MKKLVLALVLTGIAAVPVQANYALRGKVSCKDVLREHEHRHYSQYNMWWLLGYITARNFATATEGGNGMVGKDVKNEAIYDTAYQYCKANPEKDWNDAAQHTYDSLKN